MRYKTLIVLSLTLSAGLNACATTETLPPVTVHSHCVLDREIQYSTPAPGQTEDERNLYDTAETAAAIVQHNIVFGRTCPGPASEEENNKM